MFTYMVDFLLGALLLQALKESKNVTVGKQTFNDKCSNS